MNGVGLTTKLVSIEGRHHARSGGGGPLFAGYAYTLAKSSSLEMRPKSREWPPQVLLLANAEFLDYVLITLGIVVLEVIEQATTLADHHQETAAGGVILLVRLEVFRQFADPFAKHRDLYLGAAGIVVVGAEPGNDVLFTLSS